MPIVQTPVVMTPFQVEGFDKGCERSCKGALYLRPASTKFVTQGELDHLLKNYPVAKRFVVIPDPPKKKAEAAKPKPAPVQPKPAAPSPPPEPVAVDAPAAPSRRRNRERDNG